MTLDDAAYTTFIMPDADITIRPALVNDECRVIFDSQGGSQIAEIANITPGSTVELPRPEREGYVFGGWYTLCDGAGTRYTSESPIQKTLILYALWTDESSHTHTLTATAAKEPTCTEGGNIAYWYCADCGKYFADENATQEITLADTVLAPAGHAFSAEWKTDENGHWHECTRDGVKADEGEHSFVWVTDREATTTPGEKHEECTVCGTKRSEGTVIAPVSTPTPAPKATPQPTETPALAAAVSNNSQSSTATPQPAVTAAPTSSPAPVIIPETADNTEPVLWLGVSGISLLALAYLYMRRRKARK